jgi:hypothetical protein
MWCNGGLLVVILPVVDFLAWQYCHLYKQSGYFKSEGFVVLDAADQVHRDRRNDHHQLTSASKETPEVVVYCPGFAKNASICPSAGSMLSAMPSAHSCHLAAFSFVASSASTGIFNATKATKDLIVSALPQLSDRATRVATLVSVWFLVVTSVLRSAVIASNAAHCLSCKGDLI